MDSFKLLKAPLLVFFKILNLLDVIEIIDLSQTSRRTKLRIQQGRLKLLHVGVLFGMKQPRVDIYRHDYITRNHCVHFFKRKPENIIYKYTHETGTINVCEKKEQNGKVICRLDRFETDSIRFLEIISELFHNLTRGLAIEVSLIDTFEEALEHPTFFNPCKRFYIYAYKTSGPITKEQFVRVLQKTKPYYAVFILCRLYPDFEFNQIMHFPLLRICHGEKMTLEELKQMDNHTLILENHNFKEPEINQFIKNWYSGNNSKLSRLQLGGFKETPDWNVILEDVPHQEWDETQRGQMFRSEFTINTDIIDCANGKDIYRNDGLLATIVHDSDTDCLEFLVWHERFHSSINWIFV